MIAAIENAIGAALVAAGTSGQLGYRYATIDTYPDDFDLYLKDKKGALRFPAAWAVFLGLSDGDDDDTVWSGEARFALVVAAQNLRNETASRHGDSVSPEALPGSYQLAEDAVRVLHRNGLGLDLVKPILATGMRLVARTPEIRTQNLSLMAVELRCRMPIGGFDADLGYFAQLHVDWDVPPHGNVAAPLPAAEHDAEDLVELPQ